MADSFFHDGGGNLLALPAGNELSYNEVVFDSFMRTNISGTPVLDEAGRTTKFVAWTISVDSYARVTVTQALPDNQTDTIMTALRQKLTETGRTLNYRNKGFGDIVINAGAGGGQRDVNWGPIPKLFSFDPVGNNRAAKVKWQVTFHIPECATAVFQGKIMAMNYGVSYSFDRDRYTSMAVNGFIEIPLSKSGNAGDKTVPDTADSFREKLESTVQFGFQRINQNFNVTPSKSRLDFSWTDEELPVGGMPKGATNATGTFSLASDGITTVKWTATVAATYTISKRLSKTEAWKRFEALVKDRVNTSKALGKVVVGPFGVRISEGLYLNRQQSFSLSYFLVSNLKDIFKTSGIWKAVPDTKYADWAASVGTIMSVRAMAGLRLKASDDMIVDLCPGGEKIGVGGAAEEAPSAALSMSKIFDDPKPESSWVTYKNAISVMSDSGVVAHTPLPAVAGIAADSLGQWTDGSKLSSSASFDKLTRDTPDGIQEGSKLSTERPHSQILQQVTDGVYKVFLRGFAVRAGFHVPIPELKNVGGAVVTPGRQATNGDSWGSFGGIPVYWASWVLEYFLASPPSGSSPVAIPENPYLDVAG